MNILANYRCCFLLLLLFSKAAFAMMPVIDAAALAQLVNQLAELKTQTQSMQQTLQTLSGNQYQWSNTQHFLSQLQDAMQKTQGINYYSNTLQAQFQKAYPGYQVPNDFQKHYQTNVNTAQHTFCGVVENLRLHTQQVEAENAHLAFLQRQVQSAQGQTQAIQAASQITSEMVSQQQLLRQAMMTQTNAQTAYYATQLQNEVSSRAELDAVIHGGATQVPAYGASGHALVSPDF